MHKLLIFIFFLGLVFVQIYKLNAASQKTLYGRGGAVLGYIDEGSGKRAVRDRSKKVIGYIDNHSTYDKNKSRIAGSVLPGLLFCN